MCKKPPSHVTAKYLKTLSLVIQAVYCSFTHFLCKHMNRPLNLSTLSNGPINSYKA